MHNFGQYWGNPDVILLNWVISVNDVKIEGKISNSLFLKQKDKQCRTNYPMEQGEVVM